VRSDKSVEKALKDMEENVTKGWMRRYRVSVAPITLFSLGRGIRGRSLTEGKQTESTVWWSRGGDRTHATTSTLYSTPTARTRHKTLASITQLIILWTLPKPNLLGKNGEQVFRHSCGVES
jgi:hypothetical protein